MKEALLVDYGGVLTTSVLESFVAFCEREDIQFAHFKDVVLGAARTADSPFARIEIGAMDQVEFDEAVASLLTAACGRPIASADLKQRLFANIRPDDLMIDAVRTARASGVRTALLSNSWGGRDYPRDRFDELFDAVVISGEVGLRKPDAEIYALTADKLGLAPAACVFVDDFPGNVTGAEAAGMTGVLHRDAAQTIPLLEGLFERPLR
ncbi:MAG TPA: HAD family phosphatase [Actinomycetota bacterium]|nr:HAD family phosphatase [Actinomycetota bacterium]